MTRSFKAMGAPCELRFYAPSCATGDKALDACQNEVLRIEQKYSRYRDDSVTSLINTHSHRKAMTLDNETCGLIQYADTLFTQSDGLFDITSGLLRTLWYDGMTEYPTEEQLKLVLTNIGWDKVHWQAPFIQLGSPKMQLDFGGYVKEYAADATASLAQQFGIQHGVIDLAGDMRIVGPHPDGKPWQIGIQHPRKTRAVIAKIPVMSGAIATSGDYERYFEIKGHRFSHILNPHSGRPVDSFASVSVEAEQCLVAGTASTVAMLKGTAGISWLEELGLPYLCFDQDLTARSNKIK